MKTLSPGFTSKRTHGLMYRILVHILLFLACSSCASVYIPTLRNVPLLSKRGEFQSTASFGNGANVTASYAITNHIGIMTAGMLANNKHQGWGDTHRLHQSAEDGIGYFSGSDRFTFELYLGYGRGKGYARDWRSGTFFLDGTVIDAHGNYQKFFAQPTFAFRVKRVQMAATARTSVIDFHRLEIYEDDVLKRNPKKGFFFFEPSFSAKIYIREGRRSFYGFAQAGFNAGEQRAANESILGYPVDHYNVGIGVRL